MRDEWYWLEAASVLAAQRRQIDRFGGIHGVRDHSLMQSALARPQNVAAYAEPGTYDLADLAAAYAYGLVKNHAFLDGNKRIGFVAAALFIRLNGRRLTASPADATQCILDVADGSRTEAELAAWFRANMRNMPTFR